MKLIRMLLLVILIAAVSGCSGRQAVSGINPLPDPGSPQAWIDAPLPGSNLPLLPYEFVAHGSDQSGVLQLEWTLNGVSLGTSDAENPNEKLATFRLPWSPTVPGAYTLRVRAKNGLNSWSEYDEAVFTIGEPTSTVTPTPTTTSTPESTPTGTSTPTPTPTETPTPTNTSSPVGIQFSPSASVSQVFYGSCSPNTVELSVTVSPMPYSVVLFVHLIDTAGGSQTAWSSYAAMTPKGDGRFVTTVQTRSIPEVANYSNAWLGYQFVATSASGEILGRSLALSDVLVSPCGSPTLIPGVPGRGPTPTGVPPIIITRRPPAMPTATVTREFVK